MKLLKLEINNVRGVPQLLLKPDGKNFVIFGPNGSGKSAVVDAIDFLLTGQISRLTGEGTRGITLNKHGHHIDHTPEEATVCAIVKLQGTANPVEIKRCIAQPNNLECAPDVEQLMEPIMALAHRGQHVLTRRDILRYITAEAGTRAQQIQELLNITEIEDIRKTLVKVQNNLKTDYQAAKRSVGTIEGDLNATVQEEIFSEDVVLRFVNQNRATLGGQPITTLRSTSLKTELKPPAVVSQDQAININLLERDIQNLNEAIQEENRVHIAENDEQLRSVIETIKSDPQLLRVLSCLPLIKLGRTLIDETGSCPLCDKPWPSGKLSEYLGQKLATAEVAVQHQTQVTELSANITGYVDKAIASLQKVIDATRLVGLKDEQSALQSWLDNLEELSKVLSAAIEKYPDPRFGMEQVQWMLAPKNIVEILGNVYSSAKAKFPQATPEQTAWDSLTRLEENLKALERAKNELEKAELSYQRATLLYDNFLEARDHGFRRALRRHPKTVCRNIPAIASIG